MKTESIFHKPTGLFSSFLSFTLHDAGITAINRAFATRSSESWIAVIFLVMNLVKFSKEPNPNSALST